MKGKKNPINPKMLLWWVAIISLAVSATLYFLLKEQAQYDVAPPSDLAISIINAAFARCAARSAPMITGLLRPFAAMVIAFPFALRALSITFPLTINALELGKRHSIFGGRPISRALLNLSMSIPE